MNVMYYGKYFATRGILIFSVNLIQETTDGEHYFHAVLISSTDPVLYSSSLKPFPPKKGTIFLIGDITANQIKVDLQVF